MPTEEMRLDIVSAEAEIFSGTVKSLSVTGSLGEMGIMPGHTPLLTALKPGQITLEMPLGDKEIFYISGGMIEIQPDVVTVLADTAIRAQDIDEAAAEEAKNKAEQALAHHDAEFEYSRALTEVAQAAAQIRAIRELSKKVRK